MGQPKFATGHFGCGRQMMRRKDWSHDKCPICGAPDEDNKHVMMCRAVSSRQTWTESLKALREWMDKEKTHPAIRTHIIKMLESWVEDKPTPNIPFCSLETRAALQAQNNIGAWNMILGRVSASLEECQGRHYKSIKSRKSGRRWTVEIIKKLQDVAWDMWDHRNSVLHNDPTRHHRKTELEEANRDIDKEWTRGATGLLKQDHYLFRARTEVDNRSLDRKREWLNSVQGARDAAEAATAAARRSYAQERKGMELYLSGRNVRGRLLNEEEQETEGQKK